MRSFYEGKGPNDTRHHTIQYFDGQRIREISLLTLDGKIRWLERTVPGILENGIDYRTAKRRLAAYEELCTRRIG